MTTPRPTVRMLVKWLQGFGEKYDPLGVGENFTFAADILLNCGLPLDEPFYPETGMKDGPVRSCTCHPDDAPPWCQLKFAVTECWAAYVDALLPPTPTPASTAGAGEVTWTATCGVCHSTYEMQEVAEPHPNSTFCPHCRERKMMAPGVLNWSILPDVPSHASETIARLKAALERIERWQMPPTGETWDASGEPMSYGACYGSYGERDVIRRIAAQALADLAGEG